MHICFCIPAMGGGGAERTVANLLQAMAANGYRLSLLTLEAPGATSAYPLPDIWIERLDLLGGSSFKRLSNLMARRRAIRGAIDRLDPDIVVSFMDTMNIAVLIALSGRAGPIVISERTDPAHMPLPKWKSMLRRLTYPKTDRLVVPTSRVANYFRWMEREKVDVIPNPTPAPKRHSTPETPDANGRYRLISVGRLSAEKRFDLLIQVFGKLSGKFPDWDLKILGEGDQRQYLTTEIQRLALDRRVELAGWSSDIGADYAAAHLMTLPSRFEGFPNALAEASAAGLPSIGFAGVSGVENIIADGSSGILAAPDHPAEALQAALQTLMSDATLRRDMGTEARIRSQQWAPDRILKHWDNVLRELTSCERVPRS